MRARHGFTLIEVLVALTITALIGAALTGVLVNQSRFYDQQEKLSSARQVSRSALNMLMSELRMIETSGGIVAATSNSITVRVPYAMGLFCMNNSGSARVALMPMDTTIENRVTPSGWAYRSTYAPSADYTYATLNSAPVVDTPNRCGDALIAIPSAQFRMLTPAPWPEPPTGVPVMLLHEVTYTFGTSVSVPGMLALWRQASGGANEELVAPFESTAAFRFYVVGNQAAQGAPPTDLADLRGLEIVLDSRSERPGAGGGASDRANLTTSVFFKNSL